MIKSELSYFVGELTKWSVFFFSIFQHFALTMRSWMQASRGLLKQNLNQIKEEEKEDCVQQPEQYTTIQKLLQPSVKSTEIKGTSSSNDAKLRKRFSSIAAPAPGVVVGEVCLMRENPYRIHKVRASLPPPLSSDALPLSWPLLWLALSRCKIWMTSCRNKPISP